MESMSTWGFELARSLHMDLTTGEVAAARGRLSALARRRKEPDWQYKSARDADGARNEVSGDEFFAAVTRHYATLASSWFQVLWCIERIRAGRIVLASAEGLDAEPKSQRGRVLQWKKDLWNGWTTWLSSIRS